MKLPEHYRRPVFIAMLIHIVIFFILIINFAPTLFRAPPTFAPMQTIHATAIVQTPVSVSSDKNARASERAVAKKVVEKKQAEVAAKKVLVLRQEKLAKLQVAEKLKKEKAEKTLTQKKQQEKLA